MYLPLGDGARVMPAFALSRLPKASRLERDARALRLRCDFAGLDLAGRRRNSKPVFAHSFEMELDGLADLGLTEWLGVWLMYVALRR